jgi:hypothetical protein
VDGLKMSSNRGVSRSRTPRKERNMKSDLFSSTVYCLL